LIPIFLYKYGYILKKREGEKKEESKKDTKEEKNSSSIPGFIVLTLLFSF